MATYITTVSGTNDALGSTLSASTTLNVVAGDLLVALGKNEDFDGGDSMTDNDAGGSNTYTLMTAQAGSSPYSHVWAAIAKASNAALTVTFNTPTTGTDYRRMLVGQARPASGYTFSLDQKTSARGNGTAPASGSITPTSASGIAFANFGCDASLLGFVLGSGWTNGANIAGDTQSEYRLITSTAAINGNCSCNNALNWGAHVVNFIEVSAAIVGPPMTGRSIFIMP
jgi:hypothetical protein